MVPVDRRTGLPLHNAVVWLDTRTHTIVKHFQEKNGGNLDAYREHCGLRIATYFSGLKMRWLLEHVPEVAQANEEGNLIFMTIDTWLLYVR